MKKRIYIVGLLLLIVVFAGCRPPTSSGSGSSGGRSGTTGLSMSFLNGAPPKEIYADYPYDNVEVPITVEIKNLGHYPVPEDDRDGTENLWREGNDDVIIITGFDTNIISDWLVGGESAEITDNGYPYVSLSDKIEVLEGKSDNNPGGGYDLLEFTGQANLQNAIMDLYTPSFLVTACYDYVTKTSAEVCIDPRPYSTIDERKICSIGDISLSSQGAPIAITKIEPKALSNSIQYKIHFKNSGGGDVIATDMLSKCSGVNDEEKLTRNDLNLVKVMDVRIGGNSILDDCTQLLEAGGSSGYARLLNNAGFVICNYRYDKDLIDAAYTTPIFVELGYGYRTSIQKSVDIHIVQQS